MLQDKVKELATGPNFGVLATVMPDGSIQNHLVWVDADDEHVLVNTEFGRQKVRNVEHDPRVTVTVWSEKSPYEFVEVRGRVVGTVTGEEARDHIDELARKYTGGDYAGTIVDERVILKIEPSRQLIRA